MGDCIDSLQKSQVNKFNKTKEFECDLNPVYVFVFCFVFDIFGWSAASCSTCMHAYLVAADNRVFFFYFWLLFYYHQFTPSAGHIHSKN